MSEILAEITRAPVKPVKPNKRGAVYNPRMAIVPLSEAEQLNYEYKDASPWYRRVMRKQGRINRLIRTAALNLLNFFNSLPDAVETPGLASAMAELSAVEKLMANESGPAILRRLRRPQSAINEHLSCAVVIMTRWALAIEQNAIQPGADGIRQMEVVRWHANEAETLARRRMRRNPVIRRLKCDQMQINRCLIIALCKTTELFIRD